MRITEGQLRRIIRETILNEVPLGGDSPFTPIERPSAKAPVAVDQQDDDDIEDPPIYSVGYSNASENRPEAIRLFEKIPDNWDIIPVENVDNLAAFVRSLKFKQAIEDRNYPPGTKILVIGSQPSEGDFTEAEWVVRHDIVGHAIYQHSISLGVASEDKLKNIKNDIIQNTDDEESKDIAAGLVSWKMPRDQNVRPDYAVWLSLPAELQLSETYQDILPDIYAAIFFGELTAVNITAATLHYLKARFPSIAEEKRPRIAQNFAINLIKSVKDWKDSIRPGINIIRLW
jgi:hypothetical protein